MMLLTLTLAVLMLESDLKLWNNNVHIPELPGNCRELHAELLWNHVEHLLIEVAIWTVVVMLDIPPTPHITGASSEGLIIDGAPV